MISLTIILIMVFSIIAYTFIYMELCSKNESLSFLEWLEKTDMAFELAVVGLFLLALVSSLFCD